MCLSLRPFSQGRIRIHRSSNEIKVGFQGNLALLKEFVGALCSLDSLLATNVDEGPRVLPHVVRAVCPISRIWILLAMDVLIES